MNFIGRSTSNTASLIVLSGKNAHQKIKKDEKLPWWKRYRIWLYIAYGIIAIFAVATIVFTIYFLYKFFYNHHAVSDVHAIQAYNNERDNKIEERTSRTWI